MMAIYKGGTSYLLSLVSNTILELTSKQLSYNIDLTGSYLLSIRKLPINELFLYGKKC